MSCTSVLLIMISVATLVTALRVRAIKKYGF